jgi:hypothetical protein
VSDIDTVVADSLKALDPEWPIREADIARRGWHGSGLLHRSKGFSFDHLVSGTERKTPAFGAGVS